MEEEQSTGVQIGTLFQVVDRESYGTYLTTNSQGQYVLEMKGQNGGVAAFNVGELEEVVPYTVRACRITTTSKGDVHWQVKPDSLEKGDMLIDPNGTRYVVKDVNTKSRRTSTVPSGLQRILTQELDL